MATMRFARSTSTSLFLLLLGQVLRWPAPGAAAAPASAPSSVEWIIDCSQTTGDIRPINGVNNGPLDVGGTVDLSDLHRELKFPFVRLHDAHWPNPDVVDIHAVFPDLTADPQRAESYDFSRTDDYLKPIVAAGSQVIYRLGESIEHTPKKFRVNPLKDVDRWADVCLGIIRHYNEGWANGFHHHIRYWEIWNEPENRPAMWTGSDAEYFKLYRTAASKIKAAFPEVLVGGPACGYGGRLVGDAFEPTPFIDELLKICSWDKVPLDFFSWHLYSNDPRAFAEQARGIRRLLDDRGLTHTQSLLTEWNYLPDNDWSVYAPGGQGLKRERWFERIGGAEGASATEAALLFLQDAPLDAATYYAGDTNPFGLFTLHGVPRKTFYAFKAFQVLRDAPLRLASHPALPRPLCGVAGISRARDRMVILLSNPSAESRDVEMVLNAMPWKLASYTIATLDSERDLLQTESRPWEMPGNRLIQRLGGHSVCLIQLSENKAAQ